MTSSLSFLGKKKAILVEPHLVVTCCSYCLDTNLAEQGIVRPQELRGRTGLAPGTMYCSIICTPSSLSEAKWGENLLWHSWLLPTCIAGPGRERQLEDWEPAWKDFQKCDEQLEIALSLVHWCPSLGTYQQVSRRIGNGVKVTSVSIWKSAWVKLSLAPRDQ